MNRVLLVIEGGMMDKRTLSPKESGRIHGKLITCSKCSKGRGTLVKIDDTYRHENCGGYSYEKKAS